MSPAPSFGRHGERSPTSKRLPSRVIASTSCLRAPAARCPTASACAPAASHCSARATSEDGGGGEGGGSCVAICWRLWRIGGARAGGSGEPSGSPLHESTCEYCV